VNLPERLYDVPAEHAVCGSILTDPDVLIQLAGTLKPGDFTNDRTRWVYEAMLALYEQQQPIDGLTVSDMLQRERRLESAGGAAFLSKLVLDTPTALHVERYAETLVRLSLLRNLAGVAQETMKLACNANGESAGEVIEQVRGLLDGISPTMGDEDVLLWQDSIDQFVNVQMARAAQQSDPQSGRRWLTLPWESTFKRFKLRIRPGTLALVVGGSSIGKTTFMENCAEHWAFQGLQVAYFHLELSRQFMLDRRTCRLARVDLETVEAGGDEARIVDARAKMMRYKGAIHYIRCTGWSARQIVARARELKAQGLCDVLIVDYLQKMRLWMPKGYNKQDGLADAAEVIKNFVEDMGIFGMMGSQVNKKAHEAGRVTAAHVRGTGEADEKANVTLVLNRDILANDINDGEYEAGERSPIMGVRIDKNTGGRTGETKLFIKGAHYLITEIKEEVYW
jgi:replicative DNA helicase